MIEIRRTETVSSMPYAGSDIAPGNLALRQQKLSKLQRTTLDPLVNGNDAVFGDEGAVYQGFTKEHRLINVIRLTRHRLPFGFAYCCCLQESSSAPRTLGPI